VLLSAGAFGSPQLLMLSGVGDPTQLQQHGIATVHALSGVGANLQDHADAVQVWNAPHLKQETLGISLPGLARVWRGLGEWKNERKGLLTTNFAESGGFVKSSPDEAIPDLQFHFVIGKLVDHGRKTVFGHGFSCHVCVLRPKSRGRVALASARAGDAPQIDMGFFNDAQGDDLARMVRGFKLMRKVLQQDAMAKMGAKELPDTANAQSDAQIEAWLRANSDTIYHPVGTCKMGPSTDVQSVVDAQARVHGIEGLRVVDASIMPTLVGGNTNAPTMMIGEKIAAGIAAA
jgi:choline dehydrogenase-like flavoprotein